MSETFVLESTILSSSSSSSSLVPKLEIKESPVIYLYLLKFGVTSLPALFGLLSGTGIFNCFLLLVLV
jgi:hypothetical protein